MRVIDGAPNESEAWTSRDEERGGNKNSKSLVNVPSDDPAIRKTRARAVLRAEEKYARRNHEGVAVVYSFSLLNYPSHSVRYQDRNRCLACHHLACHDASLPERLYDFDRPYATANIHQEREREGERDRGEIAGGMLAGRKANCTRNSLKISTRGL